MRVIIVPNRAAAVELLDALDVELGLPRVPSGADITRVGGGIHVALAEIEAAGSWQTYGHPMQHSDGRNAVLYDEKLLRPLEGRALSLDGARTRVLREADVVTIPPAERDDWARRRRRGADGPASIGDTRRP